jgi:hypothetical protein
VREIEEEARKARTHAPDTCIEASLPAESEDSPGETITVQASSAMAWKWDTARELFHRLEGADCPASAFVEALLAEYLSGAPPAALGNDAASLLVEDTTSLHVQGPGTPERQPPPLQPFVYKGLSQEEREKLRTQWQEVHQSLEGLSNRWEFLSHDPVHVKVTVAGAEEADGRELVRPPCGGQAVQRNHGPRAEGAVLPGTPAAHGEPALPLPGHDVLEPWSLHR